MQSFFANTTPEEDAAFEKQMRERDEQRAADRAAAKATAYDDDPFADEFLPLMKGEISKAIAKVSTRLTVLAIDIRQIGKPGTDGKENGPKCHLTG
jgi:hypothetical protein